MKNYSDEVISAIQDVFDYDNCERTIRTFDSFDEFPHRFVSNGISITLHKDKDRYETCMTFLDEDVDNAFLKAWKSTAIGHFVTKDWKQANRGLEAYKNYFELQVTIKGIDMIVLLRQLDEDLMPDEEFDEYTDITYDGNHYAVVKIYINDIESYARNSEFEEDLSQFIVEEEPAPKRGRRSAKDEDEDDEDDEDDDSPEYFQSEQLF